MPCPEQSATLPSRIAATAPSAVAWRHRWAYGVTTVPARKNDLLPRTLISLKNAGFDQPRLFVDGVKEPTEYEAFGLGVTCRWPKVRTFANWVLSLWELYLRDPTAERFAIFQDDMQACRNLRLFLERTPYPERGYLNLFTMPQNEALAPSGELPKSKLDGWYQSNQRGRGAVALVFDRDTVVTLLTHLHMVERPQDLQKGWKKVDGGVVTALAKAGWKEWVHYPSLVYHTGNVSSMGNKPHPNADSFRGEDFDALTLLRSHTGATT